MDRYNRAYRDPRSPLTPLTPLSTQTFNFDDATLHAANANPAVQGKNSFRGLRPSRLNVPEHGAPAAASSRRLAGARGTNRFSEEFRRTRSVFSPGMQSTLAANTNSSAPHTPTQSRPRAGTFTADGTGTANAKIKREFKRGSPVEQPTLSPRVRSLLNRTGNSHLTEMLTRHEIDIDVLIQMTLADLEALGVRGAKELKLLLDVIKMAKKFFS